MVLLLAAVPAGAQAPSIIGVVRDSAGLPIMNAEISVLGRRATSDSLGRFYLAYPPADSLNILVRRLGYESVNFTVGSKDVADNSLDIVLRRVATELESVEVTGVADRLKAGLAGYDERRAKGLGTYVTREKIEQRNTRYLADVLRTERGVIMTKNAIRFTNYQAKNCGPATFLDGQYVPGLALDAISATDVEGVELYQSMATTPSEFRPPGNNVPFCGTIVIWTKRPILEVKRPKH